MIKWIASDQQDDILSTQLTEIQTNQNMSIPQSTTLATMWLTVMQYSGFSLLNAFVFRMSVVRRLTIAPFLLNGSSKSS